MSASLLRSNVWNIWWCRCHFKARLCDRVSFVYYFIYCLMSAINKKESTASMVFSLFNIFNELQIQLNSLNETNLLMSLMPWTLIVCLWVSDVYVMRHRWHFFVCSILNRKILKFAFLFMSMFSVVHCSVSLVSIFFKLLCFVLNHFNCCFISSITEFYYFLRFICCFVRSVSFFLFFSLEMILEFLCFSRYNKKLSQ